MPLLASIAGGGVDFGEVKEYSRSNAGLHDLALKLAAQYGREHLFSVVCPGLTDTAA